MVRSMGTNSGTHCIAPSCIKCKAVPLCNQVPCHEDVWGVEVLLHAFLTSTLVEVSGQLHTPAALPFGKSPLCLFSRRLGGPQNRLEYSGKRKITASARK
jgi:hypothetical protein